MQWGEPNRSHPSGRHDAPIRFSPGRTPYPGLRIVILTDRHSVTYSHIMGTQQRRDRERSERETRIKAVARDLLLKYGYMGINMDRLAVATEYSKGLLYKHFSCKEDLLAALSIENHEKRIAFFQRAARFEGHARERITAIGVADETLVLAFPEFQQTEHVLNVASIQEKCSDERQQALVDAHARCMTCVQNIILDAIAAGDLTLHDSQAPQHVVYGLWAMAVGAHAIAESKKMLPVLGLADPVTVKQDNQQILLDGYGWAPLSGEWDYEATRDRVRQEVFADEYALA